MVPFKTWAARLPGKRIINKANKMLLINKKIIDPDTFTNQCLKSGVTGVPKVPGVLKVKS